MWLCFKSQLQPAKGQFKIRVDKEMVFMLSIYVYTESYLPVRPASA